MKRPLNRVRQAAESCLLRWRERGIYAGHGSAGDGGSERFRRILAVLNMATVAGVVCYSIGTSFAGLRLETPVVEQISGHFPSSVLVISSLLASALLLFSSRSGRDQTVPSAARSPDSKALQIDRRDADEGRNEEVPSRILTTMSHDLRTPLNAIIGFSDMMQQEMHGPLGSDRYQSYAMHIRDSGLVLLGAIETTLALTERLSERHPGILARELSSLEQDGQS